jgi:hypothetical protein
MEARLIENASDPGSITFKDRGVYVVTPKGLHILERFITKNGIAAEHLVPVFNAQPICMKLLHLERRQSDDEIVVTRAVIEVLFRRFAGREPNISKLSNEQFDSLQPGSAARSVAASAKEHQDRAAGIPLRKYAGGVAVSVKGVAAAAATSDAPELVFYASQAVDWLVDFAALVSREESCEMLAHFVRYGFIKIVQDKASRWRDSSTTTATVVRAGGAASAAGAMVVSRVLREREMALEWRGELGQLSVFDPRVRSISTKESFDTARRFSTRSPWKVRNALDGTRKPPTSMEERSIASIPRNSSHPTVSVHPTTRLR